MPASIVAMMLDSAIEGLALWRKVLAEAEFSRMSADGLDRGYPLKWQPDAMENFSEFAAKLLQQIDHR
jgi:hypothetical protein